MTPKVGDKIRVCLDRPRPAGGYCDPIPKRIMSVRKDGMPAVREGDRYQLVRSWVRT